MAEQRFWLGSVGPQLFDDSGNYVDDPTINFIAFRALTNILLGAAPTEPENAVRLADLEGWLDRVAVADIDDPSTELASLSGTAAGSLLIVYEVADPDIVTIYSWDANASAADIPFVVAGDGGYWVAIAGRFVRSAVTLKSDLYINDTNTQIWEDGSSNLSFKDAVAGTKTLAELADAEILGDGTTGRVLRYAQLIIQDGTNAATLNCQLFSKWNGDSDGPTDNVAKGATTGNYSLDANGYNLIVEAAGLSGNCLMATGHIAYNASGTDITCDVTTSNNDIWTKFYNATSGALVDLTTLVDTGMILLNILYLTDA